MKYFAKYLPVEGGYEDGDLVIDLYHPEPSIHEAESSCKQNEGELCTKVKLFLCSRDVQFNDNAYSPRNGFYKFGYHENSYRNESIKIIGPISLTAIWVKEGAEFEEEDWCVLMTTASKKIGVIQVEKHNIDRFKNLAVKTFIGIKCPTCNTFH